MVETQLQAASRRREQPPTKILGLISDTHVPARAKEIPKQVFEVFDTVDYIVHAGDLVVLSVIDELERLAPVLAVSGNMDLSNVREKIPKTNSLKVFDWKIGVTHDPRTLFGMGRMRQIARQNSFNVLIYGHTHNPSMRWEADTLFINPGSATNPLPPFITKPTVALLTVTKEKIEPRIIPIK